MHSILRPFVRRALATGLLLLGTIQALFRLGHQAPTLSIHPQDGEQSFKDIFNETLGVSVIEDHVRLL